MENLSVTISKRFIDHIAQALDCDMVCFMNPDTYEIEGVPHDVLSGMYHDEAWQEALNRVDQWGKYITIDRPGLSESVKIMQTFVNRCIPTGNLKEQLNNTLTLRRPDKSFHKIVENSGYRDQWTTFNRRQMMQHIRKKLKDNLTAKTSLPSAVFL